jgi:hypothetical protein
MNPVNYIVRATRTLAKLVGTTPNAPQRDLTQREFCAMMTAYYENNDLYSAIGLALRDQSAWSPSIKPLRNPTFCAVEFYAATVWPGELPAALPVVGPDVLREAVVDIWNRSNWAQRKQAAVREGAITGECFLKVATTESGKPFIQVLRSENIVDWDADERGNITWLRYEEQYVPRGGRDKITHVEIWDATPEQEIAIDYGFVPFVRIPFRDAGKKFGVPAIWNAQDKIDECNLKATRLAELMFRYGQPDIALKANSVDSDGRPSPTPQLRLAGNTVGQSSALTLKDANFWELPGNSSIEHILADVKFDAHAAAIVADVDEIERDLPEVAFFRLWKEGDISGRALQYKMAPAVARAREVRGNFERGLVVANRMAITIGQRNGLYGSVGRYEDGKLDHAFKDRDVLPMTEADRADTTKVYVDMGVPLEIALEKQGGWSEEDIQRIAPGQIAETVRKAGATAGPAAPVEVQSQVRQQVVDKSASVMEAALAARVSGAVESALGSIGKELADYL